MDKIIVNVNNQAKTGYQATIGDKVYLLDKSFYESKSGKTWVYLPIPNPLNRKLVDKALLSDGYEITDKKTPRNADGTTQPRTPIRDWLEPDEQIVWDDLIQKAIKRKQIALLKEKAERLQAEYEQALEMLKKDSFDL